MPLTELTNQQINPLAQINHLTCGERRRETGIHSLNDIPYTIYNARKDQFMQNKANLPDAQMNVSYVKTKDYEQKNDELRTSKTNPIKPNLW